CYSFVRVQNRHSFDDYSLVLPHLQNYVDFVLSQKSSIIANNVHHQENFIEYIQEVGIDENSLLVDIGYAGSLQKTLWTLTKQKIDALYFVTNSKIKELSRDSIKHHVYIPYNNPLSQKFFNYVQLFELFFSATHPSVTALQKDQKGWLPSFDSNGFSARSNKVLAALHQGGVEFVEDYLHHHYELFIQSRFTPEAVMQNIFAFFENPSTKDAKLFGEIIFEDNFGANKYALISSDLDKLQLEDERLLRDGIWAQASKQLAVAKEYVDITKVSPSSEFSDHLNEVLEVIPYYESDTFEKISTPHSREVESTFLKLIIHIDPTDADAVIESLAQQHYPYFRALFVFETDIADTLREYIVANENIDYTLASLDKKLFEGEEWVVFIDRALLFEPNFLTHIAHSIEQERADIIYMDEDDYGDGKLINPQFKPDFSPELMLSQPCYIGGAIACKVESLNTLSQEFSIETIVFDAMIREQKIHHIPKILFHNLQEQLRRDYKPLIENYLNTIGLPYEAVFEQEFSKSGSKPVYSLQFANSGPDIAIIIPTKNMFDVLKVALDSLEMTTYKNYTVYIIDNDSDEDDIMEYFSTTTHKVLKISSPNGIFSYSYVNNEAVKMVDEKYILFLNNDVKVITPEWLSQMVGLIQIDGVGSVGARLYYGNDRLQHVGITNRVAPYGLPAPSFKLIDGDASGYLDYAKSIKNFSAMTAACMLTTKKIFMQMGGFDDEDFSIAYNDCDYGFKLIQTGYRNVVAPNAQLYHYEGVTRGIGVGNDKPSEEAAFVRKYKNWQDPYYNPNLTTMGTDFSIASTIVRRMPDHKFRVLMVSHNYEYEGASLILFEIAKALKESYAIEPVVLSIEDGPLREAYEEQGIEAHYFEEFSIYFAPTLEVYNEHLWETEKMIHSLGVDVLFANTVLCYWAVEAANRLKMASLWLIHESEPPFEHLREHGRFIEERGKATMTYAYKSIFVAQSTRELFEPYNFKNNFEVIYNGFDTSRVSIAMNESMRESMRQKLGIEDKFVFICPGIVSPRKAQMDAIRAYEKLPKSIKKDVVVLIVGDRASEYSTQLHEYHKKSERVVQKNIHIIAETKEIGNYYNAADAFLFTSHLESFPKVIQEAMYLKLPIVSTNTFGIKEQVFHNSSALLCDVGDIDTLSNNMQRLFEDEALREKLIDNATSALDKLPTYEEMVKAYHELLQEAYLLSKRGL
ncbi:MAG: glycosyltransferase, partial [Campylobacterota bacterium]|nr:glycosyltransferase [Campylobacterota bacterium]